MEGGYRISRLGRSRKSVRYICMFMPLRIVAEAVAFLGDVSDAGKCEVICEEAGLVVYQHGEHLQV
jgi:hypothetical protein